MILSLLRPRLTSCLAWTGLLSACAVSVACSSTNNPPPDAYLGAEVGGGAACNFASPVPNWLPVGTDTGGKPTTVADQGSTGGGTASVTCMVHPSGNGFDIALQVQVEGPMGGQVTITSPGSGAVTTAGATGITASFYNSAELGPYTDTNCTLTYKYLGQNVPISPPVAAGRIWGHIQCDKATESGKTTTVNGVPMMVSCAASADFLFEQCSQ